MSASFDEDLERCRARVGTVIRGKWRLESLIGVGGMAAVYAANHDGRREAIKILHPHVAISKEHRARFEQEALAVARLGHPATVQVHAVEVADDGSPCMVMELLEGESLGQRAFRLGTIPERELLHYVDTLLDVLAVAHERGVIHRDIKPDNLFVTSDGRLKVLDFGIARMREGGQGVHTRTGAMLGTTAYMAPEQIHARPLDGRADLFAVGATMFRIITKKRIHEAETDAALLMAMGSTQARPIASVDPNVDPKIAKIVDRALAFDRDHRYPDARAMQSDVRAVLRGEQPLFASLAAEVSAGSRDMPTSSGQRPTRAEGNGRLDPAAAQTLVGAPMPRPRPTTERMQLPGVEPTSPAEPVPSSAIWVQPTPSQPFSNASYPSAAGHHPTAAAWGSAAPVARKERKAPLAAVVILAALMAVAGSAIAVMLLLGGGDDPGDRAANAKDGVSTATATSVAPTSTPQTAATATTTNATSQTPTAQKPPTTRPPATATPTSTPTSSASARPTTTIRIPTHVQDKLQKQRDKEQKDAEKGKGK
ncbi:MAG: protein kinase [Polyangiaceae bacterium]|nr:protein kinase [Polyangiaceae bacterium]